MKSRLGREYVGGAPNADGNQCRCILVRFSSLSIGAPMRIAGAVIVGSSTRTTGVREPKSEIEEGTTGETREMCGCEDFQPKQIFRDGQKTSHSTHDPSQ